MITWFMKISGHVAVSILTHAVESRGVPSASGWTKCRVDDDRFFGAEKERKLILEHSRRMNS
jgi:hypothetical protein